MKLKKRIEGVTPQLGRLYYWYIDDLNDFFPARSHKIARRKKKNFLKLWANSYTAGLIYGSFNYDNSFRSLHCSFSWMRPRYVLGSLSNSLQKSNQQKSVWIKRKRPITHPNLCISVICCSNRRKHELKDNKKNGLWNRKK